MKSATLPAQIILFSLIWSSAFIAGSIALTSFDPYTLLTVRFAISVILIMIIIAVQRGNPIDLSAIKYGLALGALNNALYLGFSFAALQEVRPQVVIVIVSCAPLVTALLSAWSGVERISLKKLLGAGLGLAGVLIITASPSDVGIDLKGVLLATVGMAAFATGTVLFRGKGTNMPVLQVNLWQSVSGAGLLFPISLVYGHSFGNTSINAILSLLYLIVVVTIGGMSLWMILIRKSGATTASSYHLLNPFFGAMLSYVVLGDPLRANDFAGAVLISLGLLLTNQHQSEKA
ncbi:DMT family transporter [Methylobacterium currus]|uniref:DMT family transporter n=1 Tax=Methylobacterium currus TaxID=2051553 RepID=UPI001E4A0061|nr:DMT family transporter [Methylobacterium currus]UHC17882.1 DMT family transporter [Methylobacterium currus]